jgi:hypothetical protein
MPSASILDVVCKVKGVDFPAAKVVVAEMLGRNDLILGASGRKCQRTDAAALLSPPSDNRDDVLAWSYIGQRLGVDPERAPRPSTKVVGIRSLAYFDPPKQAGGKPVHVGNFPTAIFETMDCEGKRHAHRIYLSPNGMGKAELGATPGGEQRSTKKSAKKTKGDNTAGRAVIWGDPSTAEAEMIFEGVETAAAAALAFETEIASGKTIIAACITAGGIEAFKPWPAAKHVIVGADRDGALKNGRPATRRGEIAARKFAELHHREIAVSIAVPGKPGEKMDWLDVLQRDGVRALVAIEGHPWAEFGRDGKPITQNRLARLLKSYKIGPKTIRFGPGPEDTAKGYKLAQFSDVFARYLPAPSTQTVTPSQSNNDGHFNDFQSVTPPDDVTDEKTRMPLSRKECDGVTVGGDGEEKEETWTV